MPPFIRDDKQPSRWYEEMLDIQEPNEMPHQLANVDMEMELHAISVTVENMRAERVRIQQMLAEIQLRIQRSAHLNEIQRLIDARDALGQQPPTEQIAREQSALDEQIDTMMSEYP